MKIRVTTIQELEVKRPAHHEGDAFDIDAVRDSMQDTLLDAQGSTHETSDGNFDFIPGAIVEHKIEEIPETVPACPECKSNEHVTKEPPADDSETWDWVCTSCDFAWTVE